MKRMRVLLSIVVVAAIASLSACIFFPVLVDHTADGSLEAMAVGSRVVIELVGNPSTGYQWFRVEPESLDGSPIEIVEEGTFTQDDNGTCGAPGTYRYKYRAVSSGTITLRYEYKRSWEASVADTFSIVIWVQ